jgi:short-subunit dehydrogenase
MPSEPEVKTYLITGASSGIGRELARQLAGPGTKLHLIGRCLERLEAVAGEVRQAGGIALPTALDLSHVEEAARFLEQTLDGEPIDEAYLGAAKSIFGFVEDAEPGDWEELYRTNLLSVVQWAQFLFRKMVNQRAGKLVLIGSLASFSGYPTATPYATMKAGLLGLGRSLRYEGIDYGVEVYLACPGYVSTRIFESAIYRKTSLAAALDHIKHQRFPVLEADDAARRILKKTRGRPREFAFPAYATFLAWTAPRIPWLLKMIHKGIVSDMERTHER